MITGNSRRPQLTQTNIVQLFLYDADTNEPILNVTRTNPTNNAGEWNELVDDTWFGDRGLTWQPGQNFSYPFYWIVTNQNGLQDSLTINPTFTAIRAFCPATVYACTNML